MSDKVQPLGDRVIIEPIPVDSVTKSGIIIPDTAKEKPQKGIIRYCGRGEKISIEMIRAVFKNVTDLEESVFDDFYLPMEVKVGDNVMYGKHAGIPITVDDKNCLIMREADILAII